jgi:hypothetical protein
MSRRPFVVNKACFHPEAPAGCGKVIRAHTLQRSGIIQRLVGIDNHVLSFYPLEYDDGGNPRIHPVGWREASTFLGFCVSHDSGLFSIIENQSFAGSDSQILLVGYRALCHELYQKQAATDAEQVLIDNLDRGKTESDQRMIQEMLAIQSAGRRTGLQELRILKGTYDEILRTGDYSALHTAVLWFRGDPCVASTGIVHVDFDLRGGRLQNLAKDPPPMHGLTFGVLSTTEGCAFVAAWPAEFHKCDEFIRSLLTYERDEVPSLLTEFFFAYVENTYFSEAWWSALPESNRKHLMHLAGIPVQYGYPLVYSRLRHVGWELTKTEVRLS